MRTDELIGTLSKNPRSSNIARPATAIFLALIISGAVVMILSLVWLGMRSEPIATAVNTHGIFVRSTFVASIIGCSFSLVRSLSVPGRAMRVPFLITMAPFVFVTALAVHELSGAEFHNWPRHAGHAWLTCLWQISALAIPAFAILAFAVRRLAPTQLRHAGFSVGFISGAIGAMGYILHANEEAIAFSLVTYAGAILAVAATGALLGPKILRWS